MNWTLEEVVGWFERVYTRTLDVARAVPEDKLGWQPASNEFTCADLIRHIGSTELMNVSRMRSKQLIYTGHNERHGRTKIEVLTYLEACHRQCLEILERADENILTELVPTNQGEMQAGELL